MQLKTQQLRTTNTGELGLYTQRFGELNTVSITLADYSTITSTRVLLLEHQALEMRPLSKAVTPVALKLRPANMKEVT